MKLIVIGGSGLVGSHLLRQLRTRGHVALGTYRERAELDLIQLDTADTGKCETLLREHKPDWVVHAAGWTWVDGCEDNPVRAMEENCEQPVRLAALCHAQGTRFGYFSTSYIFDGETGPYNEFAFPSPINTYARSKAEAEQRIAGTTAGSALFPRVICVYGVEVRRKNFACQICDGMRKGKVVTVPSDQSGNPTWAGDIARACAELLEQGQSGPFHLGGHSPTTTRLEWAEQLVADFRSVGVKALPEFKVVAKPTSSAGQKARRPLKAGMYSSKLSPSYFRPADNLSICREIAAEG